MTHDLSFIDTLASYLEGLEESGHTQVLLDAPFADPPVPVAAPHARPRQQPAPAAPVDLPKPTPVLPDPPAPPVVPKPAARKFVWAVLNRLHECNDSLPPEKTRVVLVTEAGEVEGENQKLLSEILKAIGYQLPAKPDPFNEPHDIANQGIRILVMGNPALQAVSPAGMDLKIVRGMWQQTPQGKMLSTYAPSNLIDNNDGKKATWGDLQKLLKDLELGIPDWTRRKLEKKKTENG
jgi:hypothetical protein